MIVALLGAAACRSAQREPLSTEVASRARLIRMEDTRRMDSAWLDSALRAPDAAVRRAAALAAGRVGARTHRGMLRSLGADADADVASAALYSLGLLRDTAAVPMATTALRSSPVIAAQAAWLLGEVGEPGREPLVNAIGDTSLGAQRRGAALLALARVRPTSVAPIAPLLSHPDSAIAWRAAYVLARARSASAARAMLDATRSPWPAVRDYAARGLARSLTGDSLGAASVDALRRLARDSSVQVRVTAVRVLAPYGTAAGTLIGEALRDLDQAVRVTAAPFAHLALDTATASWEATWRAETSFVFRRALAEAGLKHGRLKGAWSDWRTDARWQRRAAAASLDGLGAPAEALARLDAPLRDTDGRVRAAAAEALSVLAESASVTAPARSRLRRSLSDADFVVRANALGALAKGASLNDLSEAIGSYAIARRDADLDARLAFWTLVDSALARTGRQLPDSVARALNALERPTDPLERARASASPRFESWRDSTGSAREDAWYEDRAREAIRRTGLIARIETVRGTIELDLFSFDAPVTVHNFISLARRGYFDGQLFHRVVPNFVVQAGDPRGDGNGGPGYAIRDELNPHRYGRGALGMALSGPNTGGSQFFVTHSAQPHLDGAYTVFGQLRSGSDVLDRIVQGDRIARITVR